MRIFTGEAEENLKCPERMDNRRSAVFSSGVGWGQGNLAER